MVGTSKKFIFEKSMINSKLKSSMIKVLFLNRIIKFNADKVDTQN